MDKKAKKQYLLLTEFSSKTLGQEFEIVLHDFQGKEHSIIYLANGHISGRSIDEPQTDKTFKSITDKIIAENDYIISHKGITNNNKLLHSSTFFIKDIVKHLNDKGVFMLKGAISEVAEKLEVSEATLYRYVKHVQRND